MTVEQQQPRVWVVNCLMVVDHWRWADGQWSSGSTIYSGDVFIVCTDEPTIDPAEMETIATCSKVDWT